jgi:flavin-dependent dehydrogenase
MTDLLVVGGGPVGLATALHAVRRGLSVTVWEPRAGAIDKACGEGLMPGGLAALQRLGVDPAGESLSGIEYRTEARSARAAFRRGPGRGVRRTTLHDALASAVRDAGVRVLPRRMTSLSPVTGGVRVDDEVVGHVIAADGLHSPTRRLLGVGRRSPVRRYGQRLHVSVAPWTSFVEVHWSRHAEAYVTPVADGLVGVAVLTSRRAPFSAHLAEFPSLVRRLAGRPLSAVQGAGPLWQRTSRRVVGRVLLVGDAAGYVDALTGEGISLGLAQAAAAVEAVVSGDLAGYEREWAAITRSYRLLTSGLVGVSSVPVLRSALVPAAAALPGVFGGLVDTLAGKPGRTAAVTT